MSNNKINSEEIKIITDRTEKNIKSLYELQNNCNINLCASLSRNIADEVDIELKKYENDHRSREETSPLSSMEIDDFFGQLNIKHFPKVKRTNSGQQQKKKLINSTMRQQGFKSSNSDIRHINETQLLSSISLPDLRVANDNVSADFIDLDTLYANFESVKDIHAINFAELQKCYEKDLSNFKKKFEKLDEFLKVIENKFPNNDEILRIREYPKLEELMKLMSQVRNININTKLYM